jgi:nitrogen fixation protein NifB
MELIALARQLLDSVCLQPKENTREARHGSACHRIGCSAGSCGSTAGQMDGMSDDIRARVQDHPCYSEDAHHYFARMHVAVAPACNIQCHYCNRKYDCANESRPGVVSELLTPDQAVKKTLAVAATIPQMTVLGIAGPGDPLANPERTFETFRQLAQKAPDIKLCVSTNGLSLPQHIDELAKHNIDHVTITINCVDPDVGAKIYPWIFWKNKRIHGREAAAILIEQQQKGLEMLVARGILVKVNSVLIPGVNDEHLKEVSKIVKAKGAFLHNVMPLIAEAEHGTFYGVMGQRSPNPAELKALQDACEGDMNMMRHCRQCRADAVGLLGEDRGDEFTMDKIEAMEIDYEAAMVVRAELRAKISAELEAKRAKAHAPPAAQVVQFLPRKEKPVVAGRPVLMAVAAKGRRGGGAFRPRQRIPGLRGYGRGRALCRPPQGGAVLRRRRDLRRRRVGAGPHHQGAGRLRSRALLEDRLRTLGQAGSRRHPAQWRTRHGAIEEAVMAVWNEMLAAGKLDAALSANKVA